MTSGTVIRDLGPELTDPAEAVFDATRTYRYLLTRTWSSAWPPAGVTQDNGD